MTSTNKPKFLTDSVYEGDTLSGVLEDGTQLHVNVVALEPQNGAARLKMWAVKPPRTRWDVVGAWVDRLAALWGAVVVFVGGAILCLWVFDRVAGWVR